MCGTVGDAEAGDDGDVDADAEAVDEAGSEAGTETDGDGDAVGAGDSVVVAEADADGVGEAVACAGLPASSAAGTSAAVIARAGRNLMEQPSGAGPGFFDPRMRMLRTPV
ncbi:hypothetical protein [Streptomyces sp. NPDC098781]|uniref:hypothetical protein n=1 Tax=Streptomyces sp. NPDC098781 TaxID=3366097 RepID=UPI0037F7F1A0